MTVDVHTHLDNNEGGDLANYPRLNGRSGGQTLHGGTSADQPLVLKGSLSQMHGPVLINPDGGRVGVGVGSPLYLVDIDGQVSTRNMHRISSRASVTAIGGVGLQSVVETDTGFSRGFIGHNARWNPADDLWYVDNIGANDCGGWLVQNNSAHMLIIHPSTGATGRTFSHANFIAGAKVTVQAGGNVGIGNAAPRTLLDVGGSSTAFAASATDTRLYVSRAGATNAVVRNNSDNVEMLVRAGADAGAVGTVSNHPFVLQRNNEERVRFAKPNDFPVTFMRDLLVIGPGQGTQNFDWHNMFFSLIAIKDPESRISWHDPINGESRGYLQGSQVIANYNTQLVLGHAYAGNPADNSHIHKHLTIESTGAVGISLGGAVPQGRIQANLSSGTSTSFITRATFVADNNPKDIFSGIHYRFLAFAILRKNHIELDQRPSIGVVLNLDIGASPVSHTVTAGLTIEFWLDTDKKVYAKRTSGSDAIHITLVGIWE